jgi:hypothetical protein
MLKAARLYSVTIALSLALTACQSAGTVASQKEREHTAFGDPERITIRVRLNQKLQRDFINNLPGTIFQRRFDWR